MNFILARKQIGKLHSTFAELRGLEAEQVAGVSIDDENVRCLRVDGEDGFVGIDARVGIEN